MLTLRGTPTLYYGDELAMENVAIPPERLRDPFGLNMPGTDQGRDPERTPMPWNDSDNAGFTDLFVTGYGRAILYHNNGNGTFTDVTAKTGLGAPALFLYSLLPA